MKTFVITAATFQEKVVPWWDKAMNDPNVLRCVEAVRIH